jgi:hypothetical protein
MTKNPNARMMQHLLCRGQNQEKDAWMEELSDLNIEPCFEIIEVIYEGIKHTRGREKHWIQYYLDQGCQLTNKQSRKRVAVEFNQPIEEESDLTLNQPIEEESDLTDKPLSLDKGFARYAKFIQGVYRISQPTTKEFQIMLNLYFGTISNKEWNMGEEEWHQNKLVELEMTGKLELLDVKLPNQDLALLATIPARDSVKLPSNYRQPSGLRWG